MNRKRFPILLAAVALAALFATPAARAVRRTDDPLALVPAEATTVGVVRWSEIRTSPLAARLLAETDRIATDGDAARFLDEMKLSPREDIDTVVFAVSRDVRGKESTVVLFEGRFDSDRVASALTSHGAARVESPHGAYYRLASHGGDEGAVAIAARHLVIAGNEPEVVAALARRETGGVDGLSSGRGLGRHLSRIRRDSSAWALVDMTHLPGRDRDERETQLDAQVEASQGHPARAVFGAMKSVSLVAFQAAIHGDSVEVAATGLVGVEETRQLLEDSLRGVLAMWRLAVQEKKPELVSVIRRFQVDHDGESVSIEGTLPASFFAAFGAEKRANAR